MPPNAPTRVPFDERPGAVNFALAAWVGLVAAVIASNGGFSHANLLQNGWVQLAGLAATGGLLAWAFHAKSEWLARRLQLGVAVSLVLHTLGAIGLANVALESAADPYSEPEKPPVVEEPITPAPVLVLAPSEHAPDRLEHERPVDTGEPQASQETPSPERRVFETKPLVLETPELAASEEPIDLLVAEQVDATPDITAATYERQHREATPELLTFDAPEVETAPDAAPAPSFSQQPALSRPRALTFSTASINTPAPAPEIAPTLETTTVSNSVSDLALAPIVQSATPARRSPTTRPSSPPLVSVAPLEFGTPTPTEPQPTLGMAPRAARPRTAFESRPARSVADSLAMLAAPAPSQPEAVAMGQGPTSRTNAETEQTTPLPGRRPTVSPQGRRPRRIASTAGAPAPAALAAPVGELVPEVTGAATAAPTAPPTIGPARTVSRPRRERAATRPLAQSAPSVPELRELEIGPGSSTDTTTSLANPPSLANASPRVASAASSRRSRPTVIGAPAAAPALPPVERAPTPAYADRQKRGNATEPADEAGAPPRTERAIELGLRFLADTQREDGRWSFLDLVEANGRAPSARADGAATGLALLALLGAGCDHYDPRYGDTVGKALDYLIETQRDDGLLFPELGNRPDDTPGGDEVWQVARYYSHGIAAIALCEAFGMTGDAKLRDPAQRSLDYITTTQTRRRGGWRYTPGVNADLSVTGWQLMALRSGELAGLTVRPEAYDNVRQFVESCRERSGQRVRFRYNPQADPNDPRTGHGRRPGTVMTAVGLLSALYLGDDPRAARMQLGANHLLAHLPTQQPEEDGPRLARISTIGNPLRDTYYWYYATQVMYHMGGDYWQAWNGALHPLLVDSQVQEGDLAGSWDPNHPLPDRWSHFGGRHYVTTMNLLSLEVYYRHLPLYDRVGD